MTIIRDHQGRFISPTRQELQEKIQAVEAAADKFLETESHPPEWLRNLICVVAGEFGITPAEFESRIKVVHPTPADPILLVDGKAIVSWI